MPWLVATRSRSAAGLLASLRLPEPKPMLWRREDDSTFGCSALRLRCCAEAADHSSHCAVSREMMGSWDDEAAGVNGAEDGMEADPSSAGCRISANEKRGEEEENAEGGGAPGGMACGAPGGGSWRPRGAALGTK